jgi:hypothetical protein
VDGRAKPGHDGAVLVVVVVVWVVVAAVGEFVRIRQRL